MLSNSSCQCRVIISLFDGLFSKAYNTRLVCALCDGRVGEHDEPVYEPANEFMPQHQIVFAHGYFSSALHEISHWCLAGKERRLQVDFGYWYRPDGRTAQQQAQFEQVEIKPQAIEWLLSLASGQVFVASADNLSGEHKDDKAFRLAVSKQARGYLLHGLPTRAGLMLSALKQEFGGQVSLDKLYWPEECNAATNTNTKA